MKTKFRIQTEPNVLNYTQQNWPEHMRRINNARTSAPLIRIIVPIIGFLISLAITGGITLIIELSCRYEQLWLDGNGNVREGLMEFKKILINYTPIFWALTIIITTIVTLLCVVSGAKKYRELLLQAEELELKTRLEYYLFELHSKNISVNTLNKENI